MRLFRRRPVTPPPPGLEEVAPAPLLNKHSAAFYRKQEALRNRRMDKDRKKLINPKARGWKKKFYPYTNVAPWDYSDWKPIKYLGRGGNGIASLWEYQGPNLTPSFKTGVQVCIKFPYAPENDPENEMLKRESETMLALGLRGNQHLVNILLVREPGALYMEYVSGGDLWMELGRRMEEGKHLLGPGLRYTEMELWRMFLCLAKGIACMSQVDETKDPKWWPWMHMDFKPDNSKLPIL